MQIVAYLNFSGNCETAMKFYEKALGGKILAMMTHAGSPMEQNVPAEWRSKIIHARLAVGDALLMASDAPAEHYAKPQGFSVTIQTKDPEEADRIFAALSEKATIKMPIQKTFWAKRFGMLDDQFGTPWMINCE